MEQDLLFPFASLEALTSPHGLQYLPEFLSEVEAHELASLLSRLPLKPFEFHGFTGNRRTLSFGLRYDYSRGQTELASEPPPFLDALRERIAKFAGLSAEQFRQIGINEYRPGAGIGWHKDKPEFGDVVGISLLSDVKMRFRKRDGNNWLRVSHLLQAQSIYVLRGEAREVWQHSIAPVSTLRYSITFRTLASDR